MYIFQDECKTHGICDHVYEGKKRKYKRCRLCRAEKVQRRRSKVKKLLVEYKGGCCQFCGYNKSVKSLHFHHLDPNEKEFGVSMKGRTLAIETLKKEVDKCILLCANCHGELHDEELKT